MFKKAIFLCFFVPVVLLAGDDQTKYSESGKLYVSIGKNMISSSEQFRQLLEKHGGNGLKNSKNWHSYLGNTEIMEHEFFEFIDKEHFKIVKFGDWIEKPLNFVKDNKEFNRISEKMEGCKRFYYQDPEVIK